MPTGRLSFGTGDSETDPMFDNTGSSVGKLPHSTDYPMKTTKGNEYNYAILRDDVLDEAVLLSTSEDYFAERESSFNNSRNSSYQRINDNLDPLAENTFYNDESDVEDNHSTGRPIGGGTLYGSISVDNNSAKSDASVSHLIDEARKEHKLIDWYKRPTVFMISTVMCMYAFSIGIGMTSEIQLLIYSICWLTNGELTNCNSPDIQQASAGLQKWASSITAIIKILVSANISSLSDIYGRKPLLIYTFALTFLSRLALIFIFTPMFFSKIAFIASLSIDALGGSMFVLLAVSNSYVVDVVDDVDRLHSLGKVVAGLFIGMALGPTLSSLLALSPQYLLRLSVVLIFISLVIMIVLLPESRSNKLRRRSRRESDHALNLLLLNQQENKSHWYDKLGLTQLVDSLLSLKLFWITRKDQSTGKLDISARLNVIYLLIIEMLISSCQFGAGPALVLYGIYWYSWDQNTLGLLVGFTAGLRALVLTFFNPWFHSKLKNTFVYHSTSVDFIDIITISLSVIALFIASTFVSIVTSEYGLIVYVIFTSFVGLASPTIHSSLLKYNTDSSKNGAWFGAMALIRNIISLISPILFLSLYVLSLSKWRPLIFGTISLFALMSIGLICAMRING